MAVENVRYGSEPGYVDLETRLRVRSTSLRPKFDNFCHRYDVPYSDTIANDHAKLSMDYAEGIARSFYGFSTTLEAEATVGRSLLFGMALRRALIAPALTILNESLLKRYSGGQGSAEELTELTSKYLRGREKLYDFVGNYMPRLAVNPVYADSSQATVGLLLWEQDEQTYQNHIGEQVREASSRLDGLEAWLDQQS